MSRPSVFNEQERAFFSTLCIDYVNSGTDKKGFYGRIWGQYLRKFPVMPTEDEILENGGDVMKAFKCAACAERRAHRLAQATYWFQNNAKRIAASLIPGLAAPVRARTLDLSNKEKRKPQLPHAWIRLFYHKPEVKAAFDVVWKAATDAGWPEKKQASFRNKWASEQYQAGDAQTRALVDKYREKGYLKDDAERYIDIDPDDDDDMIRAKQVQEYLDNLPHTLQRVVESLHKQTGWHFSVTCGGRLPRAGGDVNTLHLSMGQCKQGIDYSSWNSDHKADIENFRQFCNETWSKDECLAMSLERSQTTSPTYSTSTPATPALQKEYDSMIDPALMDMTLVGDATSLDGLSPAFLAAAAASITEQVLAPSSGNAVPSKRRRKAQDVATNHKKAKTRRNAELLAQAESYAFSELSPLGAAPPPDTAPPPVASPAAPPPTSELSPPGAALPPDTALPPIAAAAPPPPVAAAATPHPVAPQAPAAPPAPLPPVAAAAPPPPVAAATPPPPVAAATPPPPVAAAAPPPPVAAAAPPPPVAVQAPPPPVAVQAPPPPVAAQAPPPPVATAAPPPPAAAAASPPPAAALVASSAAATRAVTPSVVRVPRKRLGSSPAPNDGMVDLDSDGDEGGEDNTPLGVTPSDLDEEERNERVNSAAAKHPAATSPSNSKQNPKATTPAAISSRKSNRVRKASTKLAASESCQLDTTLPIVELIAQVEADSSLPEYFASAVRFMGSQDYGSHLEFLQMVKVFIVFEAKGQFIVRKTRTKITNRPDIIRRWMTGEQRDFEKMKSDNTPRDVVGWFCWWATLQPGWRKTTMPHSRTPPPNAQYPELKYGRLGVVTIVASLVCIYLSTEEPKLREKLAEGASDVCWVLTVAATGTGQSANDEEGKEGQPPRK
ncbi:hypothetical protein PUNSTDRAFT_138637 [Punctularia strigosozonata HHB-11173 SS5]|uniref:Uncharacterized protein n=1 Tax=Punctularia strigosozonata (strain HHB-11173) TaxID=741275 RepID=R7S1K5_PUNST|nr:uncharacterized protein PUNSTDRAFT_138637 [Punctularia strigosozonata HHB-11173 SS5]EIN04245.1 hypothetical protein PUNSTDRAFT_138637 [Punctularia strigosozonata HHB-11173 SS5]